MATVVCHVQECGNVDVPVELDLTFTDEWSGQTYTVDRVVCGACETVIDDVTD